LATKIVLIQQNKKVFCPENAPRLPEKVLNKRKHVNFLRFLYT